MPARLKFKLGEDELENEKIEARKVETENVQSAVKFVLEDEKFMEDAQCHREEEIETYLLHRDLDQKISCHLAHMDDNEYKIPTKDPDVLQDYRDNFDDVAQHSDMSREGLSERRNFHKSMWQAIPLREIKRERLDLVLKEAGIAGQTFEERNRVYEEALSVSFKRGYSVIVKRDLDEIFTNTYNPEWIKAWDANIDLSFCGDYFAVITYVTDYCMKDESGVLTFITEALKQNGDGSLRGKLGFVKDIFLKRRQVGEPELYYRFFPSLHLVDSNIKVEFVPTGFKQNRSRFLKQIDEKQAKFNKNAIKVEGHETRYFVEASGMMEKYVRRHEKLAGNLTYSQFVKRYINAGMDEVPEKYDFLVDLKAEVTPEMEEDGEYIFGPAEKKVKLPRFIPLFNADGEIDGWMKKRRPKVLRFKKWKENTEPHQFMFAEMQLYLPFADEAKLHPDSFERCKKMYLRSRDRINFVKSKVMPHLKRVTEQRELAEGILNSAGDELDPQNELDDDQSRFEGVEEHPEFRVKNPLDVIDQPSKAGAKKELYVKTVVDTDEILAENIRLLDPDQRLAFDQILKFGRDFVKTTKRNNPHPTPPLLLVHGGAGTGKSHLINVMSQAFEKTLRKAGDDPNNPYILRAAHTGSAAKLISGQTLSSTFHIAFNNKYIPLPDQIRDAMRNGLQNLKLLIIDEISMVGPEVLYEIHMKLSGDIFANDKPFGGVSVVLLGDIMQLPPIKAGGRFVFSLSKDPKILGQQLIHNLWESFSVISLKTNHRQGEDRVYADFLNRVRLGMMTEEDKQLLRDRTFQRDDDCIPKDALLVAPTNKVVNKYNTERLNELNGKLEYFKADVHSDARGTFKPKLVSGTSRIEGSTLEYEINLKVGARVMLTANMDVCDGLVNGSLGTVAGFEYNRNREVRYVMVEFDDPSDGKKHRESLSDDIKRRYPGKIVTQIERREEHFSLSRDRDYSSSGGVAVNFPLKLCFAATGHKVQGYTVKSPSALKIDLAGVDGKTSRFCPQAIVYVMLSRVQRQSQLFILDVLPLDKIKPFEEACRELIKLESRDISKAGREANVTSILSLNVRSLKKHIFDVKADQLLLANDILCFQETWFGASDDSHEIYEIDGFSKTFVSIGTGKGVGIYFSPKFTAATPVSKLKYQIASVWSEDLFVINVYRSSNSSNVDDQELVKDIFDLLTTIGGGKTIVLLGDLNFCEREESDHLVRQTLLGENFASLLSPPMPSHIEGRCIDQVYCRTGEANLDCSAQVGTSSFSDHDAVNIKVKCGEQSLNCE